MTETMTKETLGFQAEVKQLLHLMVHSLYGNKEIFLRELVSNASDAGDKLRFEAMTDAAVFENDPDPKIRVGFDAQARTITVSDNGIGMSRQEVIDHIGTIAKSGTREFFARLTSDRAKDAQLIGQFGVGFYSSFIVADRVTLTTRRAGLTAGTRRALGELGRRRVHRRGRAQGDARHRRRFSICVRTKTTCCPACACARSSANTPTTSRMPILMKKERGTDEKKVTTDEDEQINQASALWARPKAEITEEQYHEFYKHVAHDFEPPLAYTHARVEGRQEFTQLFFIPQRAPFDLWDREHRHGIKLYVRRVFIMDDAEQLLPPYLRFVRGDRGLERSAAECLARNPAAVARHPDDSQRLGQTRARPDRGPGPEPGGEVHDLLEGIRARAQGRRRRGCRESRADREAAAFRVDEERWRRADRFDVRVRRPDERRARTRFTTSPRTVTRQRENSPHLEIFSKLGVEVLLMSDRVDEWLVSLLTEFDGKPLQSVAKGGLDLSKLGGDAGKAEQERTAEQAEHHRGSSTAFKASSRAARARSVSPAGSPTRRRVWSATRTA